MKKRRMKENQGETSVDIINAPEKIKVKPSNPIDNGIHHILSKIEFTSFVDVNQNII